MMRPTDAAATADRDRDAAEAAATAAAGAAPVVDLAGVDAGVLVQFHRHPHSPIRHVPSGRVPDDLAG